MIILFALVFGPAEAYSSDITLGLGIHTGFLPEMGGSLKSDYQTNTLLTPNGIYGINRTAPGVATKKIDPILGRSAGVSADFIFMQYMILKFSLNAAINQFGGAGITIDPSGGAMDAAYSLMFFDLPIAAGVSIPAGGSVRLALCAGLALSYGIYNNSFKSATISREGSFAGFAAPMVIILKGNFFLTGNISATSSFSVYRGATDPVRSGGDYARIDFSGIRWDIGASYRIKLKSRLKRGG